MVIFCNYKKNIQTFIAKKELQKNKTVVLGFASNGEKF